MKKVLVTVTGPSASGKTELVNLLTKNFNFEKLVSVTTRPIREGEVNGLDYYFINEETFQYLEKEDQLAEQVCFNGKNYATTKDEISRVFATGSTPVVIVEPDGVDHFKTLEKQLGFVVYSLFIDAPYPVLERRFLARLGGAEPTEYDLVRLKAIKKEADEWYLTKPWIMVLHNPTNDLKNLEWFAEKLGDDVVRFSIKINKEEDNDSKG